MGDRILLIPALFTPDPLVIEKWPAFRALLLRLRQFLPVDFFRWPTLKGEQAVGAGADCVLRALHAQVRPEHHILQLQAASGELTLEALADRPARSLVSVGFAPSPNVAAALGATDLARAMDATYAILSPNLHQIFEVLMSGAEEDEIGRAVSEVTVTSNPDIGRAIGADVQTREPPPLRPLNVHALYLFVPAPIPMPEARFEIFRRFIPLARHDELHEWGIHLHKEEGGHELANKVIPFIQEVIAEREKAEA
jgi:hypothetical protein